MPLITDRGNLIAPRRVGGGVYRFSLPRPVRASLVSRVSVPGQHLPHSADLRRLGVCVAMLRLDSRTLTLDELAGTDGWHATEEVGRQTVRWTSGLARLPYAARHVAVTLTDRPSFWAHDRLALPVTAAAA